MHGVLARFQIGLTIKKNVATLRRLDLIQWSAQQVLAAKLSYRVLELILDHYDDGEVSTISLLLGVRDEVNCFRGQFDYYGYQTGFVGFRKAKSGGLRREGVRF